MNEVEFEELEHLKDHCNLLLMTVTSVETKKLHERLMPFPGQEKIVKTYKGHQTYYIGKLGAYSVIHVECTGMGSIGRDSSLNTARDAIETWSPKCLIMVGIAFGVDKKKQNIGDVLVSTSVQPYDNRKETDKETQFRAVNPPAGSKILNRLVNIKDWKLNGFNGKELKVIPGQLLSGEVLIDSAEFRDFLLKEFKEAIGGEMEGTGVFAAADRVKIDWILVKSICDYADGKKSTNKKKNQELAAKASVNFIEHALTSEIAFKEVGIEPLKEGVILNKKVLADKDLINKVLFDIYKPELKEFYFERKIDGIIDIILKEKSLWISGPVGCGKSSIVRRVLSSYENDFVYITLENCANKNVEDIYQEIHSTLCEHFQINNEFDKENVINSISGLLSQISVDNQCLKINLDELPLESEHYESFIKTLSGILIKSREIDCFQLVISCIDDPSPYIKPYNEKTSERIQFVHLRKWEESIFEEFFDFLIKKLGISFSIADKKIILTRCAQNPRKMKNFIRNYLLVGSQMNGELNQIFNFCGI